MFVPASAILSVDDKTFVIRVKGGKAEIISISRGQSMDRLVEIVGDVVSGDEVVLDASDEFKDGETVRGHLITDAEAVLSNTGAHHQDWPQGCSHSADRSIHPPIDLPDLES